MPMFISIRAGTTIQRDESSVMQDSINNPMPEDANPPTVNERQPNRSDRTPLTVPMMAMQMAPGTTANPAALALYPSTF